LTVLLVILCSAWTLKAESLKGFIGRPFLAFVLTLVLNVVYGAWLHSKAFPYAWLDESSKRMSERVKIMSGGLENRDSRPAPPPQP
jgi:hypothetical protein